LKNSQLSQTLYVHDKVTKKIVGRKVNYNDWDTDYKAILEPIEKYFHDCKGLIEKIKANGAEQREQKRLERGGPFVGMSNIACSSK